MSASSYVRVALYGAFRDVAQRSGLLHHDSYCGTISMDAMGFSRGPAGDGIKGGAGQPMLADVYEIASETLRSLDELAGRHGKAGDGCAYHRHQCQGDAGADWIYCPGQPDIEDTAFARNTAKQSCSRVTGANPLTAFCLRIGREGCYRLLGMSLMLGFLFFVSYVSVIAGPVAVVMLFVALWAALATAMFAQAKRRRSLALVHAKGGSRIRVWFRGGALMYAVCLLAAAPLALGVLLTLSQGLGVLEAVGLVVSIGVLLVAGHGLKRLTRTELRTEAADFHSVVIARRTTGGIFLLVLVLASFWIAVPDLSGMSWLHAAEYGFSNALGHDALLRYLAGFWAAADSLRIWVAERASAGFASWWLWFAVWLLVVVKKFLFVFPVLMLIQHAGLKAGSLSMPSGANTSLAHVRRVPVWLIAGVAILIPAAFLWDHVAPMPWAWATGKAVVVNVGGDTYQMSPSTFNLTLDKELKKLGDERQLHRNAFETLVDRRIDSLFDTAIANIPAYADWYYSLRGDMERTIPLVFGSDAKKLSILFDGQLTSVIKALNQNIAAGYDDAQNDMETEFVSDMRRLLAPFATHPHRQRREVAMPLSFQTAYGQYLVDAVGVDEARTRTGHAAVIGSVVSLLPRTGVIRKAVMGDKHGLAKLARPIVKRSSEKLVKTDAVKAGQRLVGKTLGKAAVKDIERTGTKAALEGAGKAASRIGLRTGGRIALTAVGVGACGVTVVCAGVAIVGTAAWFAIVEKGFVLWDEHSHRAEFEEKLARRLNHARNVVKESYKRRITSMLGDDDQLRDTVKSQVRPIDYF